MRGGCREGPRQSDLGCSGRGQAWLQGSSGQTQRCTGHTLGTWWRQEAAGSGGQGSGPMAARPMCRPGSPFRDEITLAILQLQENNRLEILKRKWWEGSRCPKEEDRRAKGQPPACVPPGSPFTAACPHSSTPGSPPTPGLGMENIGGIFVVLICGLIIAVFVAVMEFIWSTRRSAESEEVRRLAEGVG